MEDYFTGKSIKYFYEFQELPYDIEEDQALMEVRTEVRNDTNQTLDW